MLDSLITKIIDSFIAIKRNKKLDRRERFSKFFDPAFNDLLKVHSDYLAMFDHVISTLTKQNNGDMTDQPENSSQPGKIADPSAKHFRRRTLSQIEEKEIANNKRDNITENNIEMARAQLSVNRQKLEPIRIQLRSIEP